jgi:hypothetical protein
MLVIFACIAAIFSVLVDFLKKYLREHLSRDIKLISESGETRRVHIDKHKIQEEVDKLVLKAVSELIAEKEQKTLTT